MLLEIKLKIFFSLEMYEMYAGIYDKTIMKCMKCMKCMLEYMIRQYQSFLSKLVYKVEVDRLKELSKISRYSGSHFVSFLENFQTIPGNSQQNTHRSAGGCQVLLKALGLNEKESLA